ncbi:MAG TPA: hypothetical protein VLY04_21325 [Bryobacteraceae bacterium]|nr:hypothetical protein [Bryobacteraceae bacterium]
MKLATLLLISILLGCFAPVIAGEPDGASNVVIAFAGGTTQNPAGSANPYTCAWHLLLVSGLDNSALFSDPNNPSQANAYFTWKSEYTLIPVSSGGAFVLFLGPTGTATIYYKGNPVATLIRKAALGYSPDWPTSDTFTFSAQLVSSKTFWLDGPNGKPFNFNDLIPHGMTCFESGRNYSSSEAGTCIATGSAF